MSTLSKILPLIGILLIMLSCVSCSCFGLDTRKPTEPVEPDEEADSVGGDTATDPAGYASTDIVYTNQDLEDYALGLLADGITVVEAVIDGIVETFIVDDWELYQTREFEAVEVIEF